MTRARPLGPRPRAALFASALALGLLLLLPGSARPQFRSQPMPDFQRQAPESWVNSPPLHAQDLKGKVVLLDVFASG